MDSHCFPHLSAKKGEASMKFKRVSAVALILAVLVAGMPHLALAYRPDAGGGELAKLTFVDVLKAVAVPFVTFVLPGLVKRYWDYDGASGVVLTPSEAEGMVMGLGYGNFALLGKDNWVVRPSIGVAGLIRIGAPVSVPTAAGYVVRYQYEDYDVMCLAGLMTWLGREQGLGVGAGLGYGFYQNSANFYLTISW